MRTMYDSISPEAIPRNAQMVAGYIDGRYAWSAEDWARFPEAVKVTITALGLDHGVCLNLEPNGYWPADLGVGWVQRARGRGVDPSIYCNRRNHLHLVQAAFDRAGVERPHFWVAEYDGIATIPDGCVAKQHSAPEGTGLAKAPAHYDISIVADFWPGVDKGEDDMNVWDLVGFRPNRGQNLWDIGEQIQLNQAAHGATLAAIANDKDVTPDVLSRMIHEAVEANRLKAEDVAVALAPEVAREVVAALPRNEDGSLAVDVNEEQIAAEFISLVGRKLGAA